jgi:hypothetical protein
MFNSSAFERYQNSTADNRAQALQDMQTNAALGLCALADLLDNQQSPPETTTLQGVALLIRELATMAAVGVI